MTVKIIDGKKIAQEIRQDITNEVKKLQTKYGVAPNVVSIKIGSDPSSDLYLKLRDKACAEVGIKSEHLQFPEDVTEKKVMDSIKKLNSDQNVHGILIQFPIPSHLSTDRLINSLDPKKDVEGFHPKNMGATLLGNENIIPCTPYAVLTILYHENIKIQGKDVVIINHSNVVGKPLAALFLNRNATVSVCHIFTKDLKSYSKKADILISAAGVPKLINKEHIKKDSFVIDVGIIKTKEGVCGDVDFESIKDIVGKITPVPGGVGPVTVACSLKNMIKTYKNCFEDKDE